LLTKFGLLDEAIDFATENGAFEFAFELAKFADKDKLADVNLKHAMFLEDEGNFKEAEAAFIRAGKPREAILMHIHNQDWDTALRVAETHDPGSANEVLLGQAKLLFTNGDYSKAEKYILRAQRPDLAIKLYKESNKWKEAIQFAKEYVPFKSAEVHAEYDEYLSGQGGAGADHIIETGEAFEEQSEYSRAIDMYLKLDQKHTSDLNLLEKKWLHAANLSIKFLQEKSSGDDQVKRIQEGKNFLILYVYI
jgi:intraflagellar transport protein 172